MQSQRCLSFLRLADAAFNIQMLSMEPRGSASAVMFAPPGIAGPPEEKPGPRQDFVAKNFFTTSNNCRR